MDNFTSTITASIGTQPYLTSVKWSRGEIIADEPAENGGSGIHPDPFSLLAASLASCTLITLRMYIDRKQWNITDIKLDIKILQERKGIQMHTSFIKTFDFIPAVTDEQKDRLMLIADKCPVAKTLSGQIELVSH